MGFALPPCDEPRQSRLDVEEPESTSEQYDRSAASWERTEPILLSDYTARPFLIEWCMPVRGLSVLDLGCGEGYVARQLRQRGASRVMGVDVSEQMIRIAEEQESKSRLGITYWTGDASELGRIEDGSVDLAVAVFLFNYLNRTHTGLVMREVHRVLRPGGRFIFSVPHPALPFLRPKGPPFYFNAGGGGYFSSRDQQLEGRIWRRDGVSVPVRCVHKTFEDFVNCLRAAGFDTLPEVVELHVSEEHIALDAKFFEPLRDQPLHLAIRTEKTERKGA